MLLVNFRNRINDEVSDICIVDDKKIFCCLNHCVENFITVYKPLLYDNIFQLFW